MPEEPLIIRGGQSVRPAEIETVLLDHPAVAEAVVLGVPDPFWGQITATAIRLSGPLPEAAAELTRHCHGRLAPFKVPARWLFAGRLPRTAAGQPCRATLTAQLAMTAGPDRSSWTARLPAALGGAPALDPLGLFRTAASLRVPHQRRSCGLDDLGYP